MMIGIRIEVWLVRTNEIPPTCERRIGWNAAWIPTAGKPIGIRTSARSGATTASLTCQRRRYSRHYGRARMALTR